VSTPAPDPKPAIQAELQRIEEDCIHSGKAHFNAGDRWARYHYWLGIPSVVLSALAGAAFFKNYGDIAGIMSAIVAILTSLMTFLKPSERAAAHKGSGDQYLTLRNDVWRVNLGERRATIWMRTVSRRFG
jgi:hypothetical protein